MISTSIRGSLRKFFPMLALSLIAATFGLTGCTPAEQGGNDAPATTNGSAEPAMNDDGEEAAEPAAEEAAAPAAEQTAAAAGGAGSISGKVSFEGTPPTPPVIQTGADAKCAAMHKDEPLLATALVVGEAGGVANCFVYVKNPPASDSAVPSDVAVLDQKGCTYEPHILPVRVGQTLEVRNSDPTLHNVRGYCEENRAFNFGQPESSAPRTREFDKAEMAVKLKCDVHPWMTAYMFVMDNPYYAVTGTDGAYTIDGLPDGTYTVVVWQEKLGEKELEVTVSGGDATGNDVSFSI